MVDTTTTVLAFVKQTIGGNRNTWGNINNTNFDYVEEAICGRNAISTTGGATTVTQAQARKRYQDVTGALVSDATITVPNASKGWIFTNGTSGDFAVLVKTASGTATSVPAGCSVEITCDGSNGVLRGDRNEVGQMAFFGNSSAPSGWFECEGTARSRAGRGIDLYAKISTTWGVGNGVTTFNVPDAYTAGKFLRSRSASVAIGTSQSDQNLAHGHAGSTASTTLSMSGTASANTAFTMTGGTGSQSANHSHVYQTAPAKNWTATGVAGIGGSLWAGADTAATSGTDSGQAHTHSFTTDSGGVHTHAVDFSGSSASTTVTIASNGGTEARPTNLSAILCIKY